MNMKEKIEFVQKELKKTNLDGWLIYDYKHSNNFASEFLSFPKDFMATRRFFYWIPMEGSIKKIISFVDASNYNFLIGDDLIYRSYDDLQISLKKILYNASSIAMEYSPNCAIPNLSKIDAGIKELIESLGPKVVSSKDILSLFNALLDSSQIESHYEAEAVLKEGHKKAWELIANSIKNSEKISEYDVVNFLQNYIEKNGFEYDHQLICAVGKNTADPHYCPNERNSKVIEEGDLIFIDQWCKKSDLNAVFADYTQTGFVGEKPEKRYIDVFESVRKARDAAIALIMEKFDQDLKLRGFEVDRVARDSIINNGYGDYFTHRTGHSIYKELHGPGVNMDDYETKDDRLVTPKTCFSIEPAIYIPNEFGIRLECNVLIDAKKNVNITGERQNNLISLF